MFSEKGKKSLFEIILKDDVLANMSEEEIINYISMIKQYLDELKAEYVFRVHMENGLEPYEDILSIIRDYVELYKYLISIKMLKKEKITDFLNVKDLNDNEEYKEKYLLRIPQKMIMLPRKKEKTLIR